MHGRTLFFNMKHGLFFPPKFVPHSLIVDFYHLYCCLSHLPACPSTAPQNCIEEVFKVLPGKPKGLEEMWRDLRLRGWRWWSLGRTGQALAVMDSEQLGDFGTISHRLWNDVCPVSFIGLLQMLFWCSRKFVSIPVGSSVRIFLEFKILNDFPQNFHPDNFWHLSVRTASSSLNFHQHTGRSHHFI